MVQGPRTLPQGVQVYPKAQMGSGAQVVFFSDRENGAAVVGGVQNTWNKTSMDNCLLRMEDKFRPVSEWCREMWSRSWRQQHEEMWWGGTGR